MKQLDDFTLKDVSEHIIDDLAMDYEISKSMARKLFINALCYNVVVAEIKDMVETLMED